MNGSDIYLASVAKFVYGIDTAKERLAQIAQENKMIVMMANCVGHADGELCAGGSAIWEENGEIVGELDELNEGLLIFDTTSKRFLTG